MPMEGSRSARHCGKHFASVNKYLIWTTALRHFTMPTCIEGEIEAQRSWPAEPGFEPYSVVPAPVLKSGVLGVHGCSFYSEEEFPGEKDVSIPPATPYCTCSSCSPASGPVRRRLLWAPQLGPH